MLGQRLTNCRECTEIPSLLSSIDCRISMEADKIYFNIVYMLNNKINSCLIKELLHYKRILSFMSVQEEYVYPVPLKKIISRVKFLTAGTNMCR